MSENEQPEIYALDLDWDLILHLAIPESVREMQAEEIGSPLLEDDLAIKVFEWQMDHVRKHGSPATASVLEDEFNGEGNEDPVIIEAPQTAIRDLIIRLRERYVRNEGRDMVLRLGHIANENPLEVGAAMTKAGRKLADLTSRRGEVFGTEDWHRALAEYDERLTKGPGPSLGFEEVDDHFNGMMGVSFLIAPPKTYKSWNGVKVLQENLMREDGYPHYETLELPAVDVEWRLACMMADIPYWKYLKGQLAPDERTALTQTMRAAQEVNYKWEIEKSPPGERSANHIIERALNRGASCVIIDQLQYMENKRGQSLGSTNNTGDYWEVCNDLRDYSDEIPIFVLHQFNRSVMNATEMPDMQQVKGSAAIEEVGALLLCLWGTKEMRRNNIVELGTLASRHFSFNAWEIGIHLTRGCELEMLGESERDEEENDC